MDFKKATDALFSHVSHEEFAVAVGGSVAAVRQARLDPEAKAHRSPPAGWEDAVIKLAADRIQRDKELISALSMRQTRLTLSALSGSRGK